jgi:hypothetical protein
MAKAHQLPSSNLPGPSSKPKETSPPSLPKIQEASYTAAKTTTPMSEDKSDSVFETGNSDWEQDV